MKEAPSLSLILPAYNEAEHVLSAVQKYFSYLSHLQKQEKIEQFEILVVFNGCTDGSDTYLQTHAQKEPRLRIESLNERGLGLAIKKGIEESKYEYGMFYSIDVPFGLEIIEESLEKISRAPQIGMVIGSKGHPQSNIKRPLIRSIVSYVLNLLLRIFFQISIKDTQGSQLFRTAPLKERLEDLHSPGPFLQVELILSLQKAGYQIIEVPVSHEEKGRASKMKIFKDAWRSLGDLLRQARKRHQV